jgi:hypothetical protein
VRSLSAFLLLMFPMIGIRAQRPADPVLLRISLEGQPWALEMNVAGFAVKENLTRSDGRRYLYAVNDAAGVALSITLEKVSGGASLDGCREVFRGRVQPDGPFKLSEIKESQVGDMAVQEYMIHEAKGAPVEQKNLFGCIARNDVYIDIHVSKTSFKAADQPRLMAILNSSTIVASGPSDGAKSLLSGSAALLAEGNKHFALNKYDKAIGPYQEALDQEKKELKLNNSQWRVLIDNLAMAYGITGNLPAVEEVLKYGLSKDPTYPMFYFVYADLCAERNDLENTMKFLRMALKYKDNVIPGERLPDPSADDSFKRFLKNDQFAQLVAQFK